MALTPELQNRRAYSVKTGLLNLGTAEEPVAGFLATPATPYPAPGILYIPHNREISEAVDNQRFDNQLSNNLVGENQAADIQALEIQALENEAAQNEAQRLASGGYVVLVIPPPEATDPQERTNAWSRRLQKAVSILVGAQETRDRSLTVIGFGEGAARALQLSLIEPSITSAVAWNPPQISGGARLKFPKTSWLVINPPQSFQDPAFSDWAALNGINITLMNIRDYTGHSSTSDSAPTAETPFTAPATFGAPGEPSYFTPQADEARLRQQLFLIEHVGSVDAPALSELEKSANTIKMRSEDSDFSAE